MSKNKKNQQKFRKISFSYDQFWSVHFTEVYQDKTEKDYKTIIKAKSFDLAKKILKNKIKEDNSGHSVKSVLIYMLHKGSVINNLKLNITDWAHIHNASFPNSCNILFKRLIPRPEGYNNRFNKGTFSKETMFKEGHKPDCYIPPEKEKPYWIYSGKWKPWPKKDREALKEKIILNLAFNNNSRTKTAKALGISRRFFYKLLEQKFVEIDWAKEYPPPKSQYHNYDNHTAKRLESIKKTWSQKSKLYRAKYLKEVLYLKSQGKSIHYISNKLKICRGTVKKCLQDNE